MPIYLYFVSGWSPAVVAELTFEREATWPAKPQTFSISFLTEKFC